MNDAKSPERFDHSPETRYPIPFCSTTATLMRSATSKRLSLARSRSTKGAAAAAGGNPALSPRLTLRQVARTVAAMR